MVRKNALNVFCGMVRLVIFWFGMSAVGRRAIFILYALRKLDCVLDIQKQFRLPRFAQFGQVEPVHYGGRRVSIYTMETNWLVQPVFFNQEKCRFSTIKKPAWIMIGRTNNADIVRVVIIGQLQYNHIVAFRKQLGVGLGNNVPQYWAVQHRIVVIKILFKFIERDAYFMKLEFLLCRGLGRCVGRRRFHKLRVYKGPCVFGTGRRCLVCCGIIEVDSVLKLRYQRSVVVSYKRVERNCIQNRTSHIFHRPRLNRLAFPCFYRYIFSVNVCDCADDWLRIPFAFFYTAPQQAFVPDRRTVFVAAIWKKEFLDGDR